MVQSYSDFRALDPSKYIDDVSPGRTAPIVVAAANASLQSRAQADFSGDDLQVAINAAIAIEGRVVLSEGDYYSTGITVGCPVEGQGEGTVIHLTTDASTITVNAAGRLRNLKVTVSEGYTGTAVLVNGDTSGLGRVNVLDNLEIWNEGWATPTQTGTGLLIRTTPTGGLNSVLLSSFGKIAIWGFEYTMKLSSSMVGVTSSHINGNTFESLILAQGKYLLTIEGIGAGVGGTASANHFGHIQLQPIPGTVDGISISGANCGGNVFEAVRAWDWVVATGAPLRIGAGVNSSYAMGHLPGYVDGGANNTIFALPSPHYTDAEALAAAWTNINTKSFVNLLSNGDFEAGDPPTGWVNGGGCTISREAVIKITGNYSIKMLTDLGGAAAITLQTIPNYLYYRGRSVSIGVLCYCPSTNVRDSRIRIYDGISYTQSAELAKDDAWHWITVTRVIDAGATILEADLVPNSWSGACVATDALYVDAAILVEGDSCPAFSPKPSTFQTQCIKSVALDLTGGATDIEVYNALVASKLLGYTVLYAVATGAGAGVNIRVGRYQDGVALDDDYFDVSVSEINKAKGYSKFFGTDVLTQTDIAAGDTITAGTAGGKADTGAVMLFLYIKEG